jgi:hypothetical protein
MSNVIMFPIQQLSKCCSARIIWDECYKHDDGCEATCCEQCGKQLTRDCDT